MRILALLLAHNLVYFNRIEQWELYDLARDPRETNNLYESAKYASVVARLKEQLQRLREETKDLETDKRFPHLKKVIEAHLDD